MATFVGAFVVKVVVAVIAVVAAEVVLLISAWWLSVAIKPMPTMQVAQNITNQITILKVWYGKKMPS